MANSDPAGFSLEFLGTGTSVGVPRVGCSCAVCRSADPRNKRLRCAALIRCGETAVVIDTGPDFRAQMLRAAVERVDAFIITHYHADHVVGIDDVRGFNFMQRAALDCWADAPTLARIRVCFDWVFRESFQPGLPSLCPREIRLGQAFTIGPLTFTPLALDHQVMANVGLLISTGSSGSGGAPRPPALAYCVDCKRMPEETVAALRGVEVLVLDMLREKQHPTHLNLEEALALIERIGPRRTWFAHMDHEVEHLALEAKLPGHIRLAYDGLVEKLGPVTESINQ